MVGMGHGLMLRVSKTGLLLPEKADAGAEVPFCQLGARTGHHRLLSIFVRP
jgi:hypothetical protein